MPSQTTPSPTASHGTRPGWGVHHRRATTSVIAHTTSNPATAYLWSIPIAARVAVAAGGGKPIKLDRKGVVAVTIFGSRWLRTADLDPATLTLGNDDGLETAGMRKKGQPVVRSTDANGDGFADLVVDFDERTLMNQHDLVAGQELVYLLGRFRDGTHVRGAAPLD